MTTRKYSSRSQQTTLSAALTATATSATVSSGSNLRGGIDEASIAGGVTFTVVIDPDTALEEIVDITAISGNTITITRGVENAGTGQAHSAGAVIRHMITGRDMREANEHIENTTTAHGLTLANVVKTTDTGTVSTAMLASNAVTTAKITDANVTAAKLATDAVTTAKIADSAVTSGKIADGTIVNADINSSAAIAATKISGTAVTQADTGTVATAMIADSAVTSAKIADGTIVNADINSAAAIDKTKISGTAVTVGDTGTVTSTMIANDTIVNADINSSAQVAYSKLNLTNSVTNADINASAAIDWTKIAPSSTVSATELGYLDGVTSAVQTQIDSKLGTSTAASTYAPIASPALTGVPTAPTAAANTNTTQIATTAYVQTEINDLIAAAPGALDTLDELAAALGDDANFATTVTNSIATKLPLAGGTMTGAIAMGTNKITGLGDPASAQDAATKNYVDTTVIAPSNLTGPITSVGNATAIASQTGTGTKFVVDQSPTIVTPTLSGNTTAGTINNTTIPSSKTLVATDSTAYVVPSQTGNSGKYLTTNGTVSSWGTVDALPSQTSNSGKYLTTDGSTASWATIAGAMAQPTEPTTLSDGLVWVDTDGTAPTTVVTRWSKAPAAGTTSLSGNDDNSLPLSYSAGYEMVHLNGALLSRGNDYTATSGTAITLTNPTVAGDIVEVICPLQISTTDTYTQTAANSVFVAKSENGAAGKNAVINGGFDIWQRGISSATQGISTADRWYCVVSGTTTWSQDTSVPANSNVQYSLKYTTGASSSYGQLFQALEQATVIPLRGQAMVFSFYVKTTGTAFTGNLKIEAYYSTSSDAYGSQTTGITVTGGQSITPTGTWTRYSGTLTIPSDAVGLKIGVIPTQVQASGVVVYHTGVQLELGSVATAFSRAGGTIQGELAACQRYYVRVNGDATNGGPLGVGVCTSTTGGLVSTSFPVPMRIAPTALEQSGTAADYGVRHGAGSTNSSAVVTIGNCNQYGGTSNFTVASGLTAGSGAILRQSGATVAYLGWSAEL